MPYKAPVEDIRFQLEHVVGFGEVAATERFSEATRDVVDAILTEAGRIATDVLAPLNRAGDLNPARLENGVVRMPPGYGDAYRELSDGGWMGLAASTEHGGMGLPQSLNAAVNEMMSGACLSFQTCPLLIQGQIEALEHHASDALKALYLPKLVTGEWSATMNLTESQAGSDVGALRTKAEPNGDGTFAISGQKIYITWGDAEFLPNISHLVLARLPGAPQGVKGISLFLVPRNLPDADGNPGQANGVRVVSLEHKMGLHGSPTAVMEYDRARGWIVGEENGGMAAMFTMMNNARLGVGLQGVGVAEAAYQHALAYAMDRRQGRAGGRGTIVEHADVRRMLMGMRADILAARAIGLSCAAAIDMERATGNATWAARAAFLTPIAKAFGTDVGISVAHDGVQVHGGMGFVEETGAAQFSRDVRITSIYEGTNGIQAMDLVTRKLADGGDAAFRLLDEIEAGAEAARQALPDLAQAVWSAAETLRETSEWLVDECGAEDRLGVSVPYLRAFARVLGGHFLLKGAIAAGADSRREGLARFYIERLLPEYGAALAQVRAGSDGIFALSVEDLLA